MLSHFIQIDWKSFDRSFSGGTLMMTALFFEMENILNILVLWVDYVFIIYGSSVKFVIYKSCLLFFGIIFIFYLFICLVWYCLNLFGLIFWILFWLGFTTTSKWWLIHCLVNIIIGWKFLFNFSFFFILFDFS